MPVVPQTLLKLIHAPAVQEELGLQADDEALLAFHRLTREEGIMPALESSHALAFAEKLAATMTPQQSIIVNLSGRGDKDIHTVAQLDGIEF